MTVLEMDGDDQCTTGMCLILLNSLKLDKVVSFVVFLFYPKVKWLFCVSIVMHSQEEFFLQAA